MSEIVDLEFDLQSLDDESKKQRYADIASLKGFKGWNSFVEALKEKEAIQLKNMTAGLMASSVDNVYGVVEYTKGYIAGLRWARSAPTNADRVWKKLQAKDSE